MGVGFTCICKKCNNENQIYFGIGFYTKFRRKIFEKRGENLKKKI